MIIEYLQPDPLLLDGVTVLLRAGYYAASLMAAGVVLFGLGFGHRLAETETRGLRRWLVGLVLAALMLSAAALVVRVGVLTAGASFTDPAVWEAVMRSRLGDAFYLRSVGLVLLLVFVLPWRLSPVVAGLGAFLVLASYAAMGHSMLYKPRQEIAALLVVHLGVVAFWVGSLPVLRSIARRDEGSAAADLITAWSHAAIMGIVVLIATGAGLIFSLAPRLDLVTGSWWGWGLIAKLVGVAALLGFGLRHKFSMTGAVDAGTPGAADRLARSIGVEMLVVLLVFWAVAEMTSVHPIDIGHRVQ